MALPVLSTSWPESRIGIHLDDPFSEEALAEPNKGYLEVGQVDVEAFMTGRTCPDGSWDVYTWNLKVPNSEPNLPLHKPAGVVAAHQLFIEAASEILGEDRFKSAEIAFGDRYGSVREGASPGPSRPHIDSMLEVDKSRVLRLVGVFCNAVPTLKLDGEYGRESLDPSGGLKSLRNLNRRFSISPVPLNTLAIMAPALLHDRNRATAFVPGRIFGRWHLFY